MLQLNSYKNKKQSKRLSQLMGLTILEVLIALVILIVVFLGVAKAYLTLGYQHSQLQQQDHLVDTVGELIQRSVRNPDAAYFSPHLWNAPNAVSFNGDCTGVDGCSATDLRDFDLAWAQRALQSQHNLPLAVRPCGLANRHCLFIGSEYDFLLPTKVAP